MKVAMQFLRRLGDENVEILYNSSRAAFRVAYNKLIKRKLIEKGTDFACKYETTTKMESKA